MAEWQVQVPVALLIFNRPDTTARVFETIRQARPPKLLVVADGPRPDHPGEAEKCAMTRAIIDRVDWECEVLKNYSAANLGCKRRVSSGLDWVFEMIEEAIVLEDDCLPHPVFFRFTEKLLERYRNDERVMHISGDNFQSGLKRGEASYYFSRYAHVWGWGSWRRAWQHYDVEMKQWASANDRAVYLRTFESRAEREFWTRAWQGVCAGKIDTWDYQWIFACVARDGLAIVPQVNLVSNIGFGMVSTHTSGPSAVANLPTSALTFPLHPPRQFSRDVEADEYTSRLFFRRPGIAHRIFNRIRRVN